jgi:hypothetical protein
MRWIAAMLCVLAGCSSKVEPAQRLISDVDRSVRAAAPEAAQYVPDQLRDVQNRLDSLKAAFERDDYAAVQSAAPGVLTAAQALGGAAAARKNAQLKALNQEWSVLAASVPEDVMAIQGRIEMLGRNAGRKPSGVDIDAARTRLSHGASLWSKAQAAFATGNMDEAVTIAKSLESQLQNLAASLKVELSEPATAQPESAAIREPESLR